MIANEITRRGLIALPLVAMMTGKLAAQGGPELKEVYEKGITVVRGSNSEAAALKYDLVLKRGNREEPVAASRRFLNGDQFKLRFEVNKDSFVYVLYRTLDGDPERMERYSGAKGIRVVREEDRTRPANGGGFKILYPTADTGRNNRLTARQIKSVPEARDGFFEMDNNPGIEKLVILVSPTPLDISRINSAVGGAPADGGRRRNDTDDDLDSKLKEAEDNTHSTKGICVGGCYAAPQNPGKPILVNVDLRHYRR